MTACLKPPSASVLFPLCPPLELPVSFMVGNTGDVTCVLSPCLSSPDNRRRIQRGICLNALTEVHELNMRRPSCSESLVFVIDKLSLTWNHVENKQRGKGHVNNSFPQNQASHFCYCISPPPPAHSQNTEYLVRSARLCVGLDALC